MVEEKHYMFRFTGTSYYIYCLPFSAGISLAARQARANHQASAFRRFHPFASLYMFLGIGLAFCLRIHHRDQYHVENGTDGTAQLKHVYRFVQSSNTGPMESVPPTSWSRL